MGRACIYLNNMQYTYVHTMLLHVPTHKGVNQCGIDHIYKRILQL